MRQVASTGAASGAGASGRPHPPTHLLSHLAMRGAPVRAIQELAGHADLATTQRYMHLSPAAIEGAIRLLDAPAGGEIGETGQLR